MNSKPIESRSVTGARSTVERHRSPWALKLLLACWLPALLGCNSTSRVSPNSPPTPEEQAYLSKIEITNAKMMAARNLLGERIVTLDARIVNRGDRPVRYVGLRLQFMDLYNRKVVLQTNAVPIAPQAPALMPGESRPFSISFENIPPDWNQAPPQTTPTRVIF